MKTRVPSNVYGVNAAEIKLTVCQSNIQIDKKGITLTGFGSTIVSDMLGVTVNGATIKLNS